MKHFLSLIPTLLLCLGMQAQPWDPNVFNHLSVGVNASTTGFGADVAMPVCKFIQVRAGFTKMPEFGINSSLDLSGKLYIDASGIPQTLPLKELEVQGKPTFANGLIMLDVLPIPTSSFHITVGGYFGGSNIIEVRNRQEGALAEVAAANAQIKQWNAMHPQHPQEPIGLKLGDYLLTPDTQGNFRASVSVRKFRPYAGVGFGRAVPRRRIGFRTDVGCMFWGRPSISCNGTPVPSADLDGDGGSIMRMMSKIRVYPCITLRLCGRIF